MIKHLTPIGNSLGLIIDKPILDLLGIGRDTPLMITTDGKRLVVERAPGEDLKRDPHETFEAMDQGHIENPQR